MMNRIIQFLPWFVSSRTIPIRHSPNLILLVIIFYITSCENSKQQLNQFSAKRISVEQAKGVSILYTTGDKTTAHITAPLMLRHQEANPFIEFTQSIHANFFDDSLHIESKLDAHYAKYIESESKVFLRDSVVVFNTKGDTLYCQELYWDRTSIGHEFYTNKKVRIRTPTQIIDGEGLDAPQDFTSWHIINGKGFVRVPSGEFPE